jgi:hypothetical protein
MEALMNKQKLLEKLQSMTIEEKVFLLSDIDKAYIRGYLDRANLMFRPALRKSPLPGTAPEPGRRSRNGR